MLCCTRANCPASGLLHTSGFRQFGGMITWAGKLGPLELAAATRRSPTNLDGVGPGTACRPAGKQHSGGNRSCRHRCFNLEPHEVAAYGASGAFHLDVDECETEGSMRGPLLATVASAMS